MLSLAGLFNNENISVWNIEAYISLNLIVIFQMYVILGHGYMDMAVDLHIPSTL